MNATDSPLLRLPAELRNYIWSYVIGGQTIRMNLSSTKDRSGLSRKLLDSRTWRPDTNRFSLLRVSRQIYAETGTLVDTLSTFSVVSMLGLCRWLEDMAPWQLDAVQNIRSLELFEQPPFWKLQSLLRLRGLERVKLRLWGSRLQSSVPHEVWAEKMALAFKANFKMTSLFSRAQTETHWLRKWLE
jgi:hypothetical protein